MVKLNERSKELKLMLPSNFQTIDSKPDGSTATIT